MNQTNYTLDNLQHSFEMKSISNEWEQVKAGLKEGFMFYVLDATGIILSTNSKFLERSEWTPKRVIGKSIWQLLPDEESSRHKGHQILQQLERGSIWQGPIEKATKSGQSYWVQALAIPIFDEEDILQHSYIIEEEITDKKTMQTKLEEAAYTDLETGLLSRYKMEEIMKEQLSKKVEFTYVLLSIDKFYTLKELMNEQHEEALLHEFTNLLKKYFPDSEIGRMGRNEFALITPLSDWYIQGFSDFLKSYPVYLDSKSVAITVSGSMTRYPDDQKTLHHIVEAAHNSLQRVKQQGGNLITTLPKDAHSKLSRRVEIEKELMVALDQQHLEVVYLPIIDTVTKKVSSFEALVRWESEALGAVSPEELIPIAEQTGLINDIGTFVLEKSCQQAAEWQQQGYDIKVNVNLSVREFHDKNMARTIMQILQQTGCPANRLQIEITEKFALEAEAEKTIIEQMHALNREGVRFVLDDFGSGYASLRYLQLLPIESLKIDRVFIQSMTKNDKVLRLIKGMVSLAHSLQIRVLAEGIESEQQMKQLQAMGCDGLQGFHISKPLKVSELSEYFE
ncbi:EAL domain-containing protein [Chryseomicrobium aureum]|uniref:sensor domain-containing protein n=1 Tax=Chryseomicrobium aureum TaxID=1441723 RepID=UPI00370D49EE